MNELLIAIEQVFADVAELTPEKHKNVLGDKWKYINAVVDYIDNEKTKLGKETEHK